MNQILAYSFLICAIVFATIPIIGYIRAKYYYIDTKPIHYWLNKKQKTKKRYRTFKKRNRKNLSLNKINRLSVSRARNDYKLNRWNIK
jgi:hypothetical protein